MAQAEMVQYNPPLPSANTPPESPTLSPVVTLTDEQATEMENAIAAMKIIPTTPSSHCSCCQHLPENITDSATPCQKYSTRLNSETAVEFAKQIVEALKSANDSKELSPPPPVEQSTTEKPKVRASTLEFKTVNEV
jgi:hypothetical protein